MHPSRLAQCPALLGAHSKCAEVITSSTSPWPRAATHRVQNAALWTAVRTVEQEMFGVEARKKTKAFHVKGVVLDTRPLFTGVVNLLGSLAPQLPGERAESCTSNCRKRVACRCTRRAVAWAGVGPFASGRSVVFTACVRAAESMQLRCECAEQL